MDPLLHSFPAAPSQYGSEASSPTSPHSSNPSAPKVVLARNSACHQCRKRKLKCDGNKPICTNCSKPRIRGAGQMQDQEDCTWDAHKEPSARTRRRREFARRKALEQDANGGDEAEQDERESRTKKIKLNELETRISAFEAVLGTPNGNRPDGGPNVHVSTSINRGEEYVGTANSSGGVPNVNSSEVPLTHFNVSQQGSLHNLLNGSHYPSNGGVGGSSGPSHPEKSHHTLPDHVWNNVLRDTNNVDPSLNGLFDMTWPDWPRDLPPLEIVHHMINVFFDKVPLVPRMLRKSSLLQALQLPPSHSGFPIRPLLHAILAITSNFVSGMALSTRAYFPVGASFSDITHPEQDFEQSSGSSTYRYPTGSAPSQSRGGPSSPVTPLARFQLWHRRKAFDSLSVYLSRGESFLQCLQAHIIATYVDQYNAWWTDLWMETGAVMRMVTPLRLNESPNVSEGSLQRFTSQLILPATSALEQAQRDRTFWSAFVLERSMILTTTWPTSLVDDEITVELPVAQSIFELGHGPLTGVQTLQSHDLLISHPPLHHDSFSILIKAMKIAYEVNVFFRRYSRGTHSIATFLSHPTFQMLLASINNFRTSLPHEFRRPAKLAASSEADTLDRDLVMALWIIHSASLTLGEPLVTKDTWTSDCARMALTSIRATLSLLYDIAATSYDLTHLTPHCSHAWGLAARALVRFIDAANQCGDYVSASVFRSEIEVFRLALQQYGDKFPVGLRHLKVLNDLIASQDMWGGAAEDQPKECYRAQILSLVRAVGSQSATTSSNDVNTPKDSNSTMDSGCGFPSTTPFTDDESRRSSKSGKAKTTTANTASASTFEFDFGSSPALMNPNIQDGWDISSFSFDVNAVANMFEANGAMFNGPDFFQSQVG